MTFPGSAGNAAALAAALAMLSLPLVGQVPRAGALDLEALAQRVDPGPWPEQPTALPQWVEDLRASMPREPGLQESVDRLTSSRPRRQSGGDWSDHFSAMAIDLIALRIVEDAERGSQPGPELRRALLLGYDRALEASASLAASIGRPDSGLGPEFADLVGDFREDSSNLARKRDRLAARLLRGSHEPGILDALLVLSRAEMRREDMAMALGLFEERVRRLRSRADAKDWIDVARLYYANLEVELGDLALARSVGVEESGAAARRAAIHADRIQVRELGLSVRRLEKDREAEGLVGELARARLWARTGQHQRAARAYDALAARHPDDARPLTGQIQEAIRAGDLEGARRLLGRAGDLENKDAAFYEVACHVSLMWDLPRIRQLGLREDVAGVADALRQRIDTLVAGLGTTDPGRAEAFARFAELLFFQGDQDRLFESLARLLPTAVELRGRYPDLPPAHWLVIGSAVFHPDSDVAIDALLAPLPERSDRFPELARERAAAYLAICFREDREPSELANLAAEMRRDQGAPFDHDQLRGTAAAIRALRTGEESDWRVARAWLAQALPPEGFPRRAQALNNLACVLYTLEERDQAAWLWRQAEAEAEGAEAGVPTLNRLAARASESSKESEEGAIRDLEILAQRQELRRSVRAQALSRLGLLEEPGDPHAARSRFREAVAILDDGPSRAGFPILADGGVAALGRFQLVINYKIARVDLQLASGVELWLLMPAPIDEATLRARAR